jgi:hypothetical protein
MPDTIQTPCPTCGRPTLTVNVGQLYCVSIGCKTPRVDHALETLKTDAMKWRTYTQEKTRAQIVEELLAAQAEITRLRNSN